MPGRGSINIIFSAFKQLEGDIIQKALGVILGMCTGRLAVIELTLLLSIYPPPSLLTREQFYWATELCALV